MLFVHDVHAVMGERELEFEDALRDGYAAAVADDDTRLLWYFNSTHGAGEAYKVVTITAVRDGAAWERLVSRLRRGDLSSWCTRAEGMRYGLASTLLVAAPWSPIADLELASVPAAPHEHDVGVFREDTLEGPGLEAAAAARVDDPPPEDAVLTCVAAFRPALTTEEKLFVLYRVAEPARWTSAFGADRGWSDWPGSLTPTLSEVAHGSSRMLRTTSWSPLS